MSEKQFAAGGVVIKKEGSSVKALLIKDSYGHWTWPKGHIEEGETPQEAAIREISEETGLKSLKVLEEIGQKSYWFTLGGKKIFKTVHIFLVECTGISRLKAQTSEIQKAEWLLSEEAAETVEYEGSRAILEKAVELFNRKYSH